MRMYVLVIIWFLGRVSSITTQSVVLLYPDTIPNQKPTADQEFADERGIAYQVLRPTLTVFLPPDSVASGTAVLICPGGGYRALVIEREEVRWQKRLPNGA